MGIELNKILNDADLQTNLMEMNIQMAIAKSAIAKVRAAMDTAKPRMEAQRSKYNLVIPELTAEIAALQTITDTWIAEPAPEPKP